MKQAIVGLSVGILLVVGGYFGYQYLYPAQPIEQTEKYHVHSDFAVFIDGERFNFAQEKYMTSTDICKLEYQTRYMHLHDENGDVAHVHKEGQTWKDFFQTLSWTLTDDSLAMDDGKVYKNTATKKWQFFVNGKEVNSIQDYQFQDLDQVLITYGIGEQKEIEKELGMVTKKSCIYSGKCPVPEGVKLPEEHCGSEE